MPVTCHIQQVKYHHTPCTIGSDVAYKKHHIDTWGYRHVRLHVDRATLVSCHTPLLTHSCRQVTLTCTAALSKITQQSHISYIDMHYVYIYMHPQYEYAHQHILL